MPSIKSCLATLAVMALAFAPINASASKAHGVSAAVARRAAAAKSIQQKRATGEYSADSAFLNTKAALAATKIRCGTDNVCVKRTAAAPTNGAAVCVSGKCTYRCDAGFAPGGTDGTDCVASQSACDGVDCAVPANGYATCDTTGACLVGCNAGFTRYSQNTEGTAPFFCFATASDPSNCGFPGVVCPSSYNGIGTAACKSSTCKIQCPSGYFLRKAASTTNPYYCYNGESSLVN